MSVSTGSSSLFRQSPNFERLRLAGIDPPSSPDMFRRFRSLSDRLLQAGLLLELASVMRVESRTGAVALVSRWLLTKLSRRRLSPVWLGSVSCSRSSNRTGGFPASGSRKRHTMYRVTPSATSEQNAGWLDSSSIPRSFVASCARLYLRPLPCTGVTRLPR